MVEHVPALEVGVLAKFRVELGACGEGAVGMLEDLLVFKTTRGLYFPLVMPFGPTNTLACMQHFMNHIFAPLCNKYSGYFKNYMDDCSIMIEEGKDDLHHQIIVEFLQILRENHLFL